MQITVPMYEKGRSFIMACGLIKAYEGHKLVYLHLLCQGFENISKALLLAHDYDKYGPRLKKEFGHDLNKLLKELNTIRGADFISKQASSELQKLNKFYQKQQLRYGDTLDFTNNNADIKADHLHIELVVCLEDFNNEIMWS